jgi:Arc/MetJ-type ribon-helix-helix transcriptional regulator
MKLSVSLPNDDVAFLDDYGDSNGYPSRSAVLQKAVRLLRATELGGAYEEAWGEWADSDDSWDAAATDGIG